MGNKYLGECIDLEKDILPNKIIQISAGVGAGKNTWVRERLFPNYKCLYITSRRSIVNSELDKAELAHSQGESVRARRTINISELNEEERHSWWGKAPKGEVNIITTNSYIAQFIENIYDVENDQTHIWKYFDFIIVDEAHSLVADAVFTDAPFHVLQFLFKAYSESTEQSNNPKIILMTGTPEPIEWLSTGVNEKHVKKLDFMEECINVAPHEAVFVKKKFALACMIEECNAGKKVLLFVNHISAIPKWLRGFAEGGITENEIGVSFSEKAREKEFSEIIQKNKEWVESELRNAERIPDDLRVFITTSKNKEGINIWNENIDTVYIENHCLCDIRQMAGRVRRGAKRICVIVDSEGFSYGDVRAGYYLEQHCLKGVNEALQKLKLEENIPQLIKEVCDRFKYIRFDYFDQRFGLYETRKMQEMNYNTDDSNVISYYEDSMNPAVYNLEHPVQRWFRNCWCDGYEDIGILVKNYLEENKLIGIPYQRKNKKRIIEEINGLIKNYYQGNTVKQLTSLGPLLKQFRYECETVDINGKKSKKVTGEDAYILIKSK